jgi:two-component system phosphate regulon response regulator OmpR
MDPAMTQKARIAVCDDDLAITTMLAEFLRDEGYAVETANDAASLRLLVPRFRPDLVICDFKMPGEDGLSLTRWMHSEGHCAVMMLTAMGSTTDRVLGLEMGADDYVVKPFELVELRSRIKAVLRRTMSAAAASGRPLNRVRIGRCVLDIEQKALFDENGERVSLTAMEFDLLHTFAKHPRRPLNRDQLLEMAHHQKWDPFDRSIDNRIARLRKKVERNPAKPEILKTVHGEGYMFVPEGE